jgi:hypothetical protein
VLISIDPEGATNRLNKNVVAATSPSVAAVNHKYGAGFTLKKKKVPKKPRQSNIAINPGHTKTALTDRAAATAATRRRATLIAILLVVATYPPI